VTEPTIKRFEFSAEPKQFTIYANDPFTFEALPTIPIYVGTALAGLQNVAMTSAAQGVETVLQIFDAILTSESAVQIRIRASAPNDGDSDEIKEIKRRYPLGIPMMMPIINWLLESYGLRPPQPSESSVEQSADAGSTSSTVGVPAAA
jgi:hypothetical protein